MTVNSFDLLIIGAGPAGYVAAIRAAQNGMSVGLVEGRKTLGGTCLNVGCIPSKALLESSHKYAEASTHFASHGVDIDGLKLNLKQMLKRKEGVVTQLTGGIAYLMKKHKITVINGWATFKSGTELDVDGTVYSAKNILIAAGSTPVELPFAKFDGKNIIDSTDALELKSVPKHLIIIGAGVIGLEMGSVWSRLGAKVTVLDMADRPLAIMDKDLGKEAQKLMTKQGLEFIMGVQVADITTKGKSTTVTYEKDGKKETVSGDKVLVSVGRRANTQGLNLENVGVKTDRGVIQVNEKFQTSVPTVYAVGDCAPGPMLAHKGEEEGIACVDMLAGKYGHVNYNCIPWVVYTHPEVAGVGLTEEEAKAKHKGVKVGKFPFMANGRALAVDAADGFVKVIASSETDDILGVHIIGHNASEMIAEAATALEFSASAEDIARTCHAHPTLSEAVKEAALAVDGRAIHM